MGFRTGQIEVKQIGARDWETLKDVVYEARRETYTVAKGFGTDFASIPRLVAWLVPRYGIYTRSAILHDYLCRHPELLNRADADGIFRRSMRELGVSAPRRWMMWVAVRAFSLMRGASLGQWLGFLLITPLSLAFVILPALVVQIFLVAFWLVELLFWPFDWLYTRLVRKEATEKAPPVPDLQVKTA